MSKEFFENESVHLLIIHKVSISFHRLFILSVESKKASKQIQIQIQCVRWNSKREKNYQEQNKTPTNTYNGRFLCVIMNMKSLNKKTVRTKFFSAHSYHDFDILIFLCSKNVLIQNSVIFRFFLANV